MGKGDKRTRRGKITIGSYGKSRPFKSEKPVTEPSGTKKTATKKRPSKAKK